MVRVDVNAWLDIRELAENIILTIKLRSTFIADYKYIFCGLMSFIYRVVDYFIHVW